MIDNVFDTYVNAFNKVKLLMHNNAISLFHITYDILGGTNLDKVHELG